MVGHGQVLQQFPERKYPRLQREFASLEAGPVERVIEQGGEVAGGGAERAEDGFLMCGRMVALKHAEESSDCI